MEGFCGCGCGQHHGLAVGWGFLHSLGWGLSDADPQVSCVAHGVAMDHSRFPDLKAFSTGINS